MGHVNLIECTYTDLEGTAYCTPGHMVWPSAPRLQAFTARHCIKQHEIKSNTRESDAMNRHSKLELFETAAGVMRHTVLRQTS